MGYYLLFYLVYREGFFELPVWWGGLIPVLVLMVIAVWQQRKKAGDELGLAEGLRTAFLVYVLGIGLFYVFYYVLVKYLDPELMEVQRATALRNLERYGGRDARDLESFREYYEQNQPGFSLAGLLFKYLQSVIGGFILSLGLAFALRTK